MSQTFSEYLFCQQTCACNRHATLCFGDECLLWLIIVFITQKSKKGGDGASKKVCLYAYLQLYKILLHVFTFPLASSFRLQKDSFTSRVPNVSIIFFFLCPLFSFSTYLCSWYTYYSLICNFLVCRVKRRRRAQARQARNSPPRNHPKSLPQRSLLPNRSKSIKVD